MGDASPSAVRPLFDDWPDFFDEDEGLEIDLNEDGAEFNISPKSTPSPPPPDEAVDTGGAGNLTPELQNEGGVTHNPGDLRSASFASTPTKGGDVTSSDGFEKRSARQREKEEADDARSSGAFAGRLKGQEEENGFRISKRRRVTDEKLAERQKELSSNNSYGARGPETGA